VVTEAGEGVLDVTPFIVNLVITAPGTMTPGHSTFTANAGQMTLVAELRDSESGQILARVVDNQRDRSTGNLRLATTVSNLGAARPIIARWASILRSSSTRPMGADSTLARVCRARATGSRLIVVLMTGRLGGTVEVSKIRGRANWRRLTGS
jgi:hypothetical protein